VFFAVVPLAPPAEGADQSDVLKQQLSQKMDALEAANATLQALAKELEALETAKDAAAARLAELESEIVQVQDDIAQAEIDLARLRVQLEARLVNLYKYGGSWSTRYLEVLVVEDNLSAILDRFQMLTDLADEDGKLFDQVEQYLAQSQANKTLLEQKRTEQQAQLDELVESEKQLVTKKAQFASQKASLQSQIASLNTQIRQAEAAEAAARLRAVTSAANQAAQTVGATTPPANNGGSATPPTSAAAIKAQADFIYRTYLVPRKSVLSGQMVMNMWIKYGISPAESLAVMNAESGMGSLKYGGRLVSEGNNFGCLSYSANPSWLSWSPAISHGKIYVGSRNWMMFYSVSDGAEAWARYIRYGRGKDCYRPLMRAGNWTAFADIYYGANVAGKEKYIARVTWAYNMLKKTSSAAGYSW